MADEEVSHAFARGYHPEHAERLAAYWGEAPGGPAATTTPRTTCLTACRSRGGHGTGSSPAARAGANLPPGDRGE
jgi:hemoglobin